MKERSEATHKSTQGSESSVDKYYSCFVLLTQLINRYIESKAWFDDGCRISHDIVEAVFDAHHSGVHKGWLSNLSFPNSTWLIGRLDRNPPLVYLYVYMYIY